MNNCGCNQNNPCGTPMCQTNVCDCPAGYMSSDCINNVKTEFECFDIPQGQTLTEVLSQMEQQTCDKVAQVTNYLALKNIGVGANIYKGNSTIGEKEIRRIDKVGNLITVTENTDNVIVGIDETALTTFNQSIEKTYTVNNLGLIGASLYKDTTSVLNNRQFNLRKFKSSDGSIIITEGVDDINITLPVITDSSIKRFIVNSAYLGGDGDGSIQKPFATIEDAISAVMGVSTDINNPDNLGATILIQRGFGYNFTGHLAINTLTIELEQGAQPLSNPTDGWLIDLDRVDIPNTQKFEVTLILGAKSFFNCTKNGIRNSGTITNDNDFANYKRINVSGTGGILQSVESTTISYTLIESNYTTSNIYFNDDVTTIEVDGITLASQTQTTYKIGVNSKVLFKNVIFTTANPGVTPNTALIPFNQIGGTVTKSNCNIVMLFNGLTVYNFQKTVGLELNFYSNKNNYSGNVGTLYKSVGTQKPNLNIIGSGTNEQLNIVDLFISASVLLDTVTFHNNTLPYVQNDFNTQIDLTKANTASVVNKISNNIIESLLSKLDRATAVSDGLPKGSKFINRAGLTTLDPTTTWFIDIVM